MRRMFVSSLWRQLGIRNKPLCLPWCMIEIEPVSWCQGRRTRGPLVACTWSNFYYFASPFFFSHMRYSSPESICTWSHFYYIASPLFSHILYSSPESICLTMDWIGGLVALSFMYRVCVPCLPILKAHWFTYNTPFSSKQAFLIPFPFSLFSQAISIQMKLLSFDDTSFYVLVVLALCSKSMHEIPNPKNTKLKNPLLVPRVLVPQ